MKLTPNFALLEFDCRCGCSMPPDVLERVRAVAAQLQVLRDAVGPLRIVSGYRCEPHNLKVGGASRSRHLVGDAADVQSSHLSGEELRAKTESLIADGKMEDGGIGTYASKPLTLHYDVRGEHVRWRYA